MKYYLLLWLFVFAAVVHGQAADKKVIRISTGETDLIFQVGTNGRLYQAYLGARLLNETDLDGFPGKSAKGWEVYPGSGMEDYFEPALGITHRDGNMATLLKYVSSEQHASDDNVTETVITLRDEVYPVEVKLHYTAFHKENIIKAWSEIRHQEKKPVRLFRYASSMLYLEAARYFLTEFSGDWAKEVRMSSQELQFGKKIGRAHV